MSQGELANCGQHRRPGLNSSIELGGRRSTSCATLPKPFKTQQAHRSCGTFDPVQDLEAQMLGNLDTFQLYCWVPPECSSIAWLHHQQSSTWKLMALVKCWQLGAGLLIEPSKFCTSGTGVFGDNISRHTFTKWATLASQL